MLTDFYTNLIGDFWRLGELGVTLHVEIINHQNNHGNKENNDSCVVALMLVEHDGTGGK